MEMLHKTYEPSNIIKYNEHIEIEIETLSRKETEFYLGVLKEDDKNYVKFDIYEIDDTVWQINSLVSELVICRDIMFYLPTPQRCAFEDDKYVYPTEEIAFVEKEITSVEQIVDFAKDMLKHKYNVLGG